MLFSKGAIAFVTLVFMTLLFIKEAHAQTGAKEAGNAPTIELYTMGVGDRVVEKFGHAALCVRHGTRGRCYNYGTTGFDKPMQMGWGFVRGRHKFWVSESSLTRMLDSYRRWDRTVWKQVLPLSPTAARKVEEKLRFDRLEENRYYQYNHFDDNCSTRLRDIIDAATSGALKEHSEKVKMDATYRELARQGYAESTPLLVALDVLLGRSADRVPTQWDGMFLPKVLREGVVVALGVEPTLVYERQGPDFSHAPKNNRLFVIAGSLVLCLPLWLLWSRRRVPRVRGAPAVFVLSIVGLVLWFLAVASPLPELRFNEYLLFFVPLDLCLLFIRSRSCRTYARLRLVCIGAAVVLHLAGVFVQPMWFIVPLPVLALLPFAVAKKEESGQSEACHGD